MKLFYVLVLVLTSLGACAQYSWDHLPTAALPRFRNDTFNISKYGAVADGITLNTKSINDAINACSKKGGGVVLIPGGLWLTGPIVLESNVNLHLNRSAIILLTKDLNQYALVEGNWEGLKSVRNQSPVSGTDLNNIAITGSGVIDGNGDSWRMLSKDRVGDGEWKRRVASGGILSEDGKTWYPSEKSRKGQQLTASGEMKNFKTTADYEPVKDYLRPNLVVITNCKRVLLEGVTFQNSPAWCLHPILCEDLTVSGVSVKNPEWAQNGDGIDVESCKNVVIEGSTLQCGDDGICIKSGRDEEGRKRAKPTENVYIHNNFVYRAHGGFVIGSEMSGGARNIFVSDCSFMGTDRGLRFKTARGRGGIVENIYCRNIYMKDIINEAIYFDMYYFTKSPAAGQKLEIPPVNEGTPQFRNFYISNVVCEGAEKGIFIRGLPEMSIQNIHLDNIVLKTKRGVEIIEASNISLKNIHLVPGNTKPVIFIENSGNISIDGLKYSEAEVLVSISGDRSKNISIMNTDYSKAKNKMLFSNEAAISAIQMK